MENKTKNQDIGVQANSASKIGFQYLRNIESTRPKQSYIPFLFRNKTQKKI